MRKIFWAYLVVTGLVMVWYVPPFQKPDEIVHFKNVAVLIDGQSNMIQTRFFELPVRLKASDIAFKYDRKFDGKRIWEKDENKELVNFDYLVKWKNYISYFPGEIGVWLGSYSPYPAMAFYMGRLAGLILFLICILLSMLIIPKKYFGLVMAYAIMPMVIQQVTEVSYDVFLLCLPPLILAIFLRALMFKRFWWWFLILTGLLFLFVLVKQGYYPMLLLVVILLGKRFKDQIISRPWIMSVPILLTIPLLLWVIDYLKSGAAGNVYPMMMIRRDPLLFFRIMEETWTAQSDFYLRSILGYFGWLDYQFDLYQYLLVFGIVVVFFTKSVLGVKKAIVGWYGLMVIGLIILGTYALIEIGFLMQWTTVGAMVIEGVQGRYFLPLVPLLFFGVSQIFILLGKKKAKILILGLVGFVLIWGMTDKIYRRYYDLSDNFRNKGEMQEQFNDIDKQKLKGTFLSSRKKLSLNFHISETDILGGFEVAVGRESGDISIPYRYSIKDNDCSRELMWGYINNAKLNAKKNSVYLHKFKETKLGYRDICFEIEPIVKDNSQIHFDYVVVDEEPLVRLLFISDEVLE